MTHVNKAGRPPIIKALRLLCGITAFYDCMLGIGLIFLLPTIGSMMGIEPPNYPDNAQLNGAFLVSVAFGYVAAMRNLENNLWYIWIMGVGLHLMGAAIILYNVVLVHRSPLQFGIFGIVDGLLGVLFLINLRRLQKQGI